MNSRVFDRVLPHGSQKRPKTYRKVGKKWEQHAKKVEEFKKAGNAKRIKKDDEKSCYSSNKTQKGHEQGRKSVG